MELSRKLEALLRSLYTRHGRRKSGCCVCEGVRAVGELFARRPELVRFTVATERGLAEYGPVSGELYLLSESRFAEFSGTVNSQGILAVAAIPAPPGEETPPEVPFIFALDGLGDPGNFGTICRTLRSTGLDELWYTKGSIDPYGDKAIRSGLGVQFALKLRCFENLEALRAAAARFGYDKVFLTDPHQGESCFTAPDLFQRSVVVIGGEANGVNDLPQARRVTIPMPGNYESLNAAQAATVFLFEYVRRLTTA